MTEKSNKYRFAIDLTTETITAFFPQPTVFLIKFSDGANKFNKMKEKDDLAQIRQRLSSGLIANIKLQNFINMFKRLGQYFK